MLDTSASNDPNVTVAPMERDASDAARSPDADVRAAAPRHGRGRTRCERNADAADGGAA